MSELWTPGAERTTTPKPRPSAPAEASPTPNDPASGPSVDESAELAALRAELAATPVADIIANHAIGLWQLAVLHLGVEPGANADLGQARLAIDAMGALVEGLGPDLGAHHQSLTDALAQLRLAFVQIQAGTSAPS